MDIKYRAARINGKQVDVKTTGKRKTALTYHTEYMVKIDTRWHRVNCFQGVYYIQPNDRIIIVEMGE